MNINEVHWNFSDNGTKEPAKSWFWNFCNFWTAWNFFDAVFTVVLRRMSSIILYVCLYLHWGLFNFFKIQQSTYHFASQLVAASNSLVCPDPWPTPANICITTINSGNPLNDVSHWDRSRPAGLGDNLTDSAMLLPSGMRAERMAWATVSLTGLLSLMR